MTAGALTPHRSPLTPERDSFWYLVHAEWTKFRTVRGWVIAAGVTILAITALAFPFSAISAGCAVSSGASGTPSAAACPPPPTGPGGEPVADAGLAVERAWAAAALALAYFLLRRRDA